MTPKEGTKKMQSAAERRLNEYQHEFVRVKKVIAVVVNLH